MAKTDHNDMHAKTKHVSCTKLYHSIYDPAELARAIRQLQGNGFAVPSGIVEQPDDDGAWRVDFDPTTLTSEDANRYRALERIAADHRGHRRQSIVGSTDMVREITALAKALPHFSPAIDLVARAALVSARTQTPLRLPPIVLLGEPGIGKTYALRRLAEAIGADFSSIATNMIDAFRLRGMNTAWRGARMGRIAEMLLGSSTAPVILADEFDKAVGDRIERPYDIWHSLLERENAVVFRDDFLEIELRADQIIWFMSANDVSPLPASIQDRLLVLEIPKPDREQLGIIVASIYTDSRKAYGDRMPEHADAAVLDALARHNPRRIGKLIDLSFGYAAAGGRQRLNVEDIHRALQLVGDSRKGGIGLRGPLGFT